MSVLSFEMPSGSWARQSIHRSTGVWLLPWLKMHIFSDRTGTQCWFHPVQHQKLSWSPSWEPARSEKACKYTKNQHRNPNDQAEEKAWMRRALCNEWVRVDDLCVNVANAAETGVCGWTSSIRDQTRSMFDWLEESKVKEGSCSLPHDAFNVSKSKQDTRHVKPRVTSVENRWRNRLNSD